VQRRLGLADDNQKADGITVLSFSQARRKANLPVATLTTTRVRSWTEQIATNPPISRQGNPLSSFAEKRFTGNRDS